ncbi:MAG TPA: polysaccharide biosynthesis tyrosine autokinase [Verrucomicrobiae bacterium]|jgi:succinoglycan biosynthesis transport protein ExoP|nr:polysaccharide biosynthesis tyrosine autokinase [Verrucomicrobiae bacterium]
MDPSKPTATPESRLHFLDYWRIIRIRKAVIILVFLLVSITAAFVTFLLPKSYSSKARIEVHLPSTDIANFSGPSMANSYDPYFIETEFQVIQSQTILDKVIDQLNLNDHWTEKYNRATKFKTAETRRILQGMISLAAERNTSLIDITVYADDSNEAQQIAEKVAEVYEQYRHDEWAATMNRGIDALEKTMNSTVDLVKVQQTNVDNLRVEEKVADLDANSSTSGSSLQSFSLATLQQQKIEAETRLAGLNAELSKLTNLPPDVLRQTLPTIEPDAQLSTLLQDKAEAEQRLITQRANQGPENPELKTTLELLAKLDSQIDERVNGLLVAIQTKADTVAAAARSADQQLEDAKSNDLVTTARTRPYYRAKEELEDTKKMLEVIRFKVEQEQANGSMPTGEMVKIIDHAEVMPNPVRPNKAVNIILGVVVGLVVGFGLAFFIEYLDTSVKTIDDVERTLQSPVLGVIPQNVGYLLDEGAESPHAEAYRVLRTNLLFSRKDDKLNTIAVVSAGAGEGKSTTVCNLATVFAQGGQRVLMVDSDLRRPTLHRLMQVANTLGLTNYLLKQNTLEEVIQTTKLPTLDFMASGKLPSSSLGVLSSAQMRDLITELKRRYDYVFFDSPPIMGVSDASILASEVDMTLQVIQYRRYPQPMNIRAKQLIEKVGGNLIGIVLNNINMAQDESYYYYSGYYHDYYGKNEEESAPTANGAGQEKPRVDIKPKS